MKDSPKKKKNKLEALSRKEVTEINEKTNSIIRKTIKKLNPDDSELRNFLLDREIIAVIPSKNNRLIQIPHDKHIYKERNCIERFFNRIKQFRRVATRYDKLAITFMGAILIASILIWLKG